MRKRTGVIRYNLQSTGRSFTGQPRKLDINAAMRLFNGPAVQESVRKGDIVGYVGHQYREKFGLDVPETVIENGQPVVLEPAVRVVMVKCLPDGTLEHEEEFLNTAAGRIAARLWDSKAYGFSSAIYAPEENGVRVPKGFFGMDFVRAPNYDANRGYAAMLDSAGPGCFAAAELFVTENAALLDAVDGMIRAEAEQAREISEAYLQQCRLNDELLEANARLLEKLQGLKAGAQLLDNAASGPMERPLVMDKGQALLDSAQRFMAAELPVLEQEPEQNQPAPEVGPLKKALSVVGSVFTGG